MIQGLSIIVFSVKMLPGCLNMITISLHQTEKGNNNFTMFSSNMFTLIKTDLVEDFNHLIIIFPQPPPPPPPPPSPPPPPKIFALVANFLLFMLSFLAKLTKFFVIIID